uniref:Uncharacterized protein n=1 Tax=Heterorhabditis bacteriophora TaxID=37862 RepID=A0A1I7W937_HETBA
MGPWTSKEGQKMYVAIYTCLTTRAVHLENYQKTSTGSFKLSRMFPTYPP